MPKALHWFYNIMGVVILLVIFGFTPLSIMREALVQAPLYFFTLSLGIKGKIVSEVLSYLFFVIAIGSVDEFLTN